MSEICSRCIMDTTDPDIRFDSVGVCNHCRLYDRLVRDRLYTGETGRKKLDELVRAIKKSGKGRDYDCVIGVSGGVDSTFTAYKVKELGLRPLAVHLDNGWDSELSVKNIENALKKLGIELYTHVLNWEEFRDLQLAFLKASTPDSEIPTDHAIVTLLYDMAKKLGVKYIISGCNVRTESHLPDAWSRGHADWRYIRGVHDRFGTARLTNYPHRSYLKDLYYRRTIEWIDLLNYINYVKAAALQTLERELGWKYYGGKHFESVYTRFYQGYILPKKFGYDKRRMHLSSLICSREITRSEALAELLKDPYPQRQQQEDKEYVIKKLGLSPQEFEDIMALPRKEIQDYPRLETTIIYKAVHALAMLKNLNRNR